jgi:hypothetical protein
LRKARLGPGHKADARPQKDKPMIQVTVSENSLVKRINRKLEAEGEQLRALRHERDWSNLGDHYIVNDRNAVVAAHVDPEALGRELGVLRPNERVA